LSFDIFFTPLISHICRSFDRSSMGFWKNVMIVK